MVDYHSLIDKYYAGQDQLRALLYLHSRQVADLSLSVCARHPEWQVDTQFIKEAAMLHDIGIYQCDAPGIQCFGQAPYIQHGIIGAEILRQIGWERHARVCERHTGTGLTKWDIEQQQLPLPHQDYMPVELEEQVICYADKFYSKTHPGNERTVVEAMRSLEKFGWDGVKRFQKWVDLFE